MTIKQAKNVELLISNIIYLIQYLLAHLKWLFELICFVISIGWNALNLMKLAVFEITDNKCLSLQWGWVFKRIYEMLDQQRQIIAFVEDDLYM